MTAQAGCNRRAFLRNAGLSVGSASLLGLGLSACDSPAPERYTEADIESLAAERGREQEIKGEGEYGHHVYPGYRGLAELPWFELDTEQQLVCVDDSIPLSIDIHSHLGMSLLFEPRLDLHASTPRVKHLLDCDKTNPGCPFDLDVYANSNFSEEALGDLRIQTIAQGLWGSSHAATQTIPNLLREMDAMRVQKAFLLPIKLGLPFGDNLAKDWRAAIKTAGARHRLHCGLSVNPRSENAFAEMQAHAAQGARIIKLHPTMQRFYPDDPAAMLLYEEALKLGLVVFFHGGRAGIEPESSHSFAMPRHYEAALREFPNLQFILGHAGARDMQGMLALALSYDNAWLDIHGQGLSRLEQLIQKTGGERLLFGTDWPFYHIGASLAKVLITTQKPARHGIRYAILRGNAETLLPDW